jgi:hypothetical protein
VDEEKVRWLDEAYKLVAKLSAAAYMEGAAKDRETKLDKRVIRAECGMKLKAHLLKIVRGSKGDGTKI